LKEETFTDLDDPDTLILHETGKGTREGLADPLKVPIELIIVDVQLRGSDDHVLRSRGRARNEPNHRAPQSDLMSAVMIRFLDRPAQIVQKAQVNGAAPAYSAQTPVTLSYRDRRCHKTT